ncbi:hypothetical protein PCANC_15196 [Puccinia coronata f. sp. avenae]|nr:hypothetical protein PCANC_15196 [Puccinia coronata f. sp. avenae]
MAILLATTPVDAVGIAGEPRERAGNPCCAIESNLKNPKEIPRGCKLRYKCEHECKAPIPYIIRDCQRCGTSSTTMTRCFLHHDGKCPDCSSAGPQRTFVVFEEDSD